MVTVVVILLVIAGPAISSCLNGTVNMGVCLRTHMVDAGILPSPTPTTTIVAEPELEPIAQPATTVQVADTPAPATTPSVQQPPAATVETPAPAPEPAVTSAAPEPEPEPATIPAPGAEPVATPMAEASATAAPSLVTLLRVEPDGAMVLAGMAPPGVTVEIIANDEVIGTTVAEKSGDWVFAPTDYLAPGGTELTTRIAGSDVAPAQSFAIVVDDAKSAEPLVVASTPGEASKVLQGMLPPKTSAEAKPAMPLPAAPAETVAPDATVAAADPTLAPSTLTKTPPTIDAIEIDGGRDFFAGAGPEGATVRLYVNDAYVADAVVTGGRWLVEADKVLTAPAQRVRVDVLAPNSSDVAARAEVNFVVELPAPAPETATPVAPETAVAAPAEQPAAVTLTEPPAVAAQPAETAAVQPDAVPSATPVPTTTVAGVEPPPKLTPAEPLGTTTAIAAPPEQTLPPPAELDACGAAPDPNQAPRDIATTAEAAPATPPPAIEQKAPVAVSSNLPPDLAPNRPTPSVVTLPKPQITNPPPDLIAETTQAPTLPAPTRPPRELTGEPEIPTLLAVPTGGEGESARFAAGKVIIRRGDSLWTIARRTYGEGLKYTMIFEANEDQIRNPNQIYPGQVFELPTSGDARP